MRSNLCKQFSTHSDGLSCTYRSVALRETVCPQMETVDAVSFVSKASSNRLVREKYRAPIFPFSVRRLCVFSQRDENQLVAIKPFGKAHFDSKKSKQ